MEFTFRNQTNYALEMRAALIGVAAPALLEQLEASGVQIVVYVREALPPHALVGVEVKEPRDG